VQFLTLFIKLGAFLKPTRLTYSMSAYLKTTRIAEWLTDTAQAAQTDASLYPALIAQLDKYPHAVRVAIATLATQLATVSQS
jgi:hypothetical protein